MSFGKTVIRMNFLYIQRPEKYRLDSKDVKWFQLQDETDTLRQNYYKIIENWSRNTVRGESAFEQLFPECNLLFRRWHMYVRLPQLCQKFKLFLLNVNIKLVVQIKTDQSCSKLSQKNISKSLKSTFSKWNQHKYF